MTKGQQLVMSGLLSAALLAGCDGGTGGATSSSPRVAGVQSVDAKAPGNPAAPAADLPAGNSDTITLALRYVSYQDSDGKPVIDQAQSQQIVSRVNELYAPCNVRFTLEEFITPKPQDAGLAYGLTSMSELDPTRDQFDTMDKLVVINTGNWDHSSMGSANAWTNMPGNYPPGAVLEALVATNAEIVAHELGHYLNLDHVSNTSNLLNPIIYKTSTELTSAQCQTVRQAAGDFWTAARR